MAVPIIVGLVITAARRKDSLALGVGQPVRRTIGFAGHRDRLTWQCLVIVDEARSADGRTPTGSTLKPTLDPIDAATRACSYIWRADIGQRCLVDQILTLGSGSGRDLVRIVGPKCAAVQGLIN